MQSGYRVCGAGNFEVHVAECIFCTEDVGEREVLALVVDQTHRNTSDWRHDWHTRIHQRKTRRAHRGHRGAAVGRQHFADETQRVGKVFLTWNDWEQGALGECTVADFAALWRTNATCFAVSPRGHVVVMHVTLRCLRGDRVDHLVHLWHRHRQHVENLCLAALKQARAVRRWEHAHLCGNWAKICWTTAVNTDAVFDNALAHQLLCQRTNRFFNLLLLTGKRARLS